MKTYLFLTVFWTLDKKQKNKNLGAAEAISCVTFSF